MATYTAGDQINRALRLLGVLAEGETPSASESADALLALDQMLDSWSTERLSVFATMDQVFTWPSGQISRTLGPTGDFVGIRPIELDDSTYFVAPNYGGISYPIQIINQEQYNDIPLKTVQSTFPQVLFVNQDFPDTSLYVYPVPTTDLTFHFVSVKPLDQPSSLTTILNFPPGYLKAFVYNLALEIAPEFGVEPSKDVRRNAVAAKRNIKRINDPGDLMSVPAALLGNRSSLANVYSGYP